MPKLAGPGRELTLILQLQRLLHLASIARLDRLHRRLVQLDDQFRKHVTCACDATCLSRNERRKEIIAESRKDLEGTVTSDVFG